MTMTGPWANEMKAAINYRSGVEDWILSGVQNSQLPYCHSRIAMKSEIGLLIYILLYSVLIARYQQIPWSVRKRHAEQHPIQNQVEVSATLRAQDPFMSPKTRNFFFPSVSLTNSSPYFDLLRA